MAERILVLPGDGIGPEVTHEARRVLEAAAERAGLSLSFEESLIGGASMLAGGLRDDWKEAARADRSAS